MIWWQEDLERFRDERTAIEALAVEVDWFNIRTWRIDDQQRLVVDADIELQTGQRPISLRFPNHFPFSPPLVMPRGVTIRWSGHQYGPGGELCLEYGPDNWDPSISGRAMLESAHKLLASESPDNAVNQDVLSRHDLTLGQLFRGEARRCVISGLANLHILPLPVGQFLDTTVSIRRCQDARLYGIRSWGTDPVWDDPSFPKTLMQQGYSISAKYAQVDFYAFWPRIDDVDTFWLDLSCITSIERTEECFVLLRRGPFYHAYHVFKDVVRPVAVIFSSTDRSRLEPDHQELADRKVGIVGCGSVGSKIAVSLARSGVGNFLLVDDDILLPENMVRHELDWREIGAHKAEALSRRIDLVNPHTTVAVRQHRLGGQEASGGIESLIQSLSECDLLIDATATPEVFNYLSAASAIGKKPMIWAEVHAGGTGGLVARHRPGVEPGPMLMRRAIDNWCAAQRLPVVRHFDGYDTSGPTGPMVADDADVSVIAAHATRFAIDQLIPRSPSIFPYPAYFVGLANDWLFTEPFQTHPIPIEAPEPVAVGSGLTDDEASEELKRTAEILLGAKIEAATP